MRRPRWASAFRFLREWAPTLFIAGLLLCFGLIAQEVTEGEPIAFDHWLMLALRQTSDLSLPIGPRWLLEVRVTSRLSAAPLFSRSFCWS